MIIVNAKSIGYTPQPIIKNIKISFGNGEKVLIIGRNGSGKSTLLKYMLGMLPQNEGIVEIFGKNIFTDSREKILSKIGVIFPNQQVYGFLTVKENIEIFKTYLNAKNENIDILLEELNLISELNKKAKELSVGNLQKLNLAIAFLKNPELLILDEPFLGIDRYSLNDIISKLNKIVKEENATVIITTHEFESIKDWFTKIIIIDQTGQIKIKTKEDILAEFENFNMFFDSLK